MSRWFWPSLASVLILGAILVVTTVRDRRFAEVEFQKQAALVAQNAARTRSQLILYSGYRIAPGNTFRESLEDYGVEPAEAADIIGTAQPVYDLGHVRAGNRLSIGRPREKFAPSGIRLMRIGYWR